MRQHFWDRRFRFVYTADTAAIARIMLSLIATTSCLSFSGPRFNRCGMRTASSASSKRRRRRAAPRRPMNAQLNRKVILTTSPIPSVTSAPPIVSPRRLSFSHGRHKHINNTRPRFLCRETSLLVTTFSPLTCCSGAPCNIYFGVKTTQQAGCRYESVLLPLPAAAKWRRFLF